MPSCGVITREGTSVEEVNFALFWSYTSETDYSIVMEQGDMVDLSNESMLFTGEEDCEGLSQNFSYIVEASMPVDGATTTGYLRQSADQGAEKLTATTIGLSAFMSAKLSQLF